MDEPWNDRDPGDETDDADEMDELAMDGETEIFLLFDPEYVADDEELPDWAICPRGHFAWLRPDDGKIYCEHPECGGGRIYDESWTGERFPRRAA